MIGNKDTTTSEYTKVTKDYVTSGNTGYPDNETDTVGSECLGVIWANAKF